MNAFTIKDLENLSGIKAHTIRIWEQRYSFLKPQRTDTNIRYYNNDELKKLLNVALLNKYGFKISHIDKMNEVEIKDRILSLSQVQAQQERIINELIQSMVDMDLDEFETTLDNYIMARGIERTITQIIFPYLEKIGILWSTNHINPAQEHLVTNIIRQKLIVGIESISTHMQVNKTILLFLPEGEHHELGLLFIFYLLRSRGIKVIYLGSNVPVNDVEYVVKIKKPDFAYAHLTSLAHNFNMEKFLNNLQAKVKPVPVIISGQVTQQYRKTVPQGIHFKRSLPEVMEYISTL
ncbi:MAG: MerR family transcriptional regulator [Chitinophagaceae bacterium]|jgi:methanogenic corrinoid protein MtbC1|nr:MerR family transcriptional regulator [Chitinophagaceae bacterium]